MNSENWLERYEEHCKVRGFTVRTIQGYRCDARLFLEFLAARGLDSLGELRREDLEAFQLSLHHRLKPDGRPLTARTRCSKLSGVLAFLRFLYRTQVLLTDLGRHIVLPRIPRRLLPELPTEEDIVLLLEVPNLETPLGLRDRAIMELFYSSAIRNSELRLLKLEDVDLERLTVRVLYGKGNKSRAVPMGEIAAFWIERYLAESRTLLLRNKEHGFLFCSVRGEPLRVEPLCRLVAKHAEAAGLKMKVTPHILRHCCATHMLGRKAGLRHLQELLGHSSPVTTKIYTRVELSDLREVHRLCHPRERADL